MAFGTAKEKEREVNSTNKDRDRMGGNTSAVYADSFIYPPLQALLKKPKSQITKDWQYSFGKEYTG